MALTTYIQDLHNYQFIDNYIFLHHAINDQGTRGVLIVIPSYADSVTDTMGASFSSSTILTRSAPIFSYSSSGPRSVQAAFTLHRDMMTQINYGVSNALIQPTDDDYTEAMIRQIQAAVVPTYASGTKMVDPPLVTLKLGTDIAIKGIVNGSVGLTYQYPLMRSINADGSEGPARYATVDISFSVTEVAPYDSSTIMSLGSYRGINTDLGNRNTYIVR